MVVSRFDGGPAAGLGLLARGVTQSEENVALSESGILFPPLAHLQPRERLAREHEATSRQEWQQLGQMRVRPPREHPTMRGAQRRDLRGVREHLVGRHRRVVLER